MSKLDELLGQGMLTSVDLNYAKFLMLKEIRESVKELKGRVAKIEEMLEKGENGRCGNKGK